VGSKAAGLPPPSSATWCCQEKGDSCKKEKVVVVVLVVVVSLLESVVGIASWGSSKREIQQARSLTHLSTSPPTPEELELKLIDCVNFSKGKCTLVTVVTGNTTLVSVPTHPL
jgi:flagellar basal body-associated protein FliL